MKTVTYRRIRYSALKNDTPNNITETDTKDTVPYRYPIVPYYRSSVIFWKDKNVLQTGGTY